MFGTVYVIFLLTMMSLPIVHTSTIHYKNFLNGVITGLRIITNQFVVTVAQNQSGIWPGLFVVYTWCLIYFLMSVMIKLGVWGMLLALTFYFMGTVFDMKNRCMSGLKEEQLVGDIDFASKPVMKRPTKITMTPTWKFDSDDESPPPSSCSTPPSSPDGSPPSSQRSTSPVGSDTSTPSSPKSPTHTTEPPPDLTEKEQLELLRRVGNGTTLEEDLELLNRLADGSGVSE